jgi:hypothetical protein
MQTTEHKIQTPEEGRDFPNGHAEILRFSDEPVAVIDWFGASHYAEAVDDSATTQEG